MCWLCFFMKEEIKKGQKAVNNYLRYSGLGFQIAGTIGVGVFIGYKLDEWQQTSQPYYTLTFSVVFLFLGLYFGLREFMKKK
jgi:F0F1-type ATP synthase assembly protein I